MQQVLERDRKAVQRAAREARFALEIGRLRARYRVLAIDVDIRVQLWVESVDTCDARFDDFERRCRAGCETPGQLAERRPGKVVGHVGSMHDEGHDNVVRRWATKN